MKIRSWHIVLAVMAILVGLSEPLTPIEPDGKDMSGFVEGMTKAVYLGAALMLSVPMLFLRLPKTRKIGAAVSITLGVLTLAGGALAGWAGIIEILAGILLIAAGILAFKETA